MADNNPTPPFDLIIFGASGFTGKYVIRETLKFATSQTQNPNLAISFAIAGRNREKLAESLRWAAHPNSPPPITIFTADTADDDSLRQISRRTRLILNCVGPFRLHGEPVVRACVDEGCDYLDISGEPEFMERMEAEYHERAARQGSLVVSACGFDSIPAELGLLFNSRQWGTPATVNSVEAYLSLESEKRIVGNFATYESAVLGVANAEVLRGLRRSRPKRTRPEIPGPPPMKGAIIEHNKGLGLWALRLPSADAAVVRRTLSTLADNPHGLSGMNESADHISKREQYWSTVKPAHFGVKIATKSLLGTLRIIGVGVFIGLFGNFSIGRWLLLKFPSFFSFGWFKKKGPTEEQVKSATFKMWFVGKGFSDVNDASIGNKKPDYEIITRVTGPEIGYLTTPITLVQCALVILNERESMPRGGVFPPGILFGQTDLQERLQKNGISFDVISKNALTS